MDLGRSFYFSECLLRFFFTFETFSTLFSAQASRGSKTMLKMSKMLKKCQDKHERKVKRSTQIHYCPNLTSLKVDRIFCVPKTYISD